MGTGGRRERRERGLEIMRVVIIKIASTANSLLIFVADLRERWGWGWGGGGAEREIILRVFREGFRKICVVVKSSPINLSLISRNLS